MVALDEPEHQDARLHEFEPDSTKLVVGVIRAERSVREGHGHRIRRQRLAVRKFLILIHHTVLAVYHVSAHPFHLMRRPARSRHDGIPVASIERVTGRPARQGSPCGGQLGLLITTPILGAAFMLVWSQLGLAAATRGEIATSPRSGKIVATNYGIIVAHNVIGQARELIAAMPPI